jgi:hypothetical protein
VALLLAYTWQVLLAFEEAIGFMVAGMWPDKGMVAAAAVSNCFRVASFVLDD